MNYFMGKKKNKVKIIKFGEKITDTWRISVT